MKKVIVFSTLSCPQAYQRFTDGGGDLPVAVGAPIVIAGGANVASRNLHTPKGVATSITEEQYAILLEDRHFMQHVKAGFVTVEASEKDAEKVAAESMKASDASAPLKSSDFSDAKAGAKPAAKSSGNK